MKGILSSAIVLMSMLLMACRQGSSSYSKLQKSKEPTLQTKSDGRTIGTRFSVPNGFERTALESTSFSAYLRNLPLKPIGSEVKYYNGTVKPNRNVYEAVVDLPIGNRDLHQCADAVMRLRAEYLYRQKKYDSIHFNFTNGFKAEYSHWRKGKRIVVNGNRVNWKQSTGPSDSYQVFWKYMEMVFSYAGTASLSQEMKPVLLENLNTGDVFIQGGFPGHSVIVVDVAINKNPGEKIFLIAQSYMPAQEIQILKNPNNPDLSPWYSCAEIGTKLKTPEWTFKKDDLKRFAD